jgi:PAS domain S-box-containing protein
MTQVGSPPARTERGSANGVVGRSRLRTLVPWFVLVVGIVTTVATVAVIRQLKHDEDRARFDRDVSEAREQISRRMAVHIALLQGAAGLFAASEVVTRSEFHSFVERLDFASLYPGVRGLGFSRRIRPGELADVISMMHAQGHQSFALRPEGVRDEYHAILYLEPLDERNRAAIGYDMSTEETRRVAMSAARDQGVPVASGRVELVQEITGPKQAGFLIYVPVYDGGSIPTTMAERRERLFGYVYSPFRADDLLRGVFGQDPRVDIEVHDGVVPVASSLMHSSALARDPAASDGEPRFTSIGLIDIARRPWTIRYLSRELGPGESPLLATLLGISGILISTFLTWLTFLQVRARDEAEEAAHLLDIERGRFRTTLVSVGEAVIAADPEGRVTFMNAVAEQLTGWTASEALGKPAISVAPMVDEATGVALPPPLGRLEGGAEIRSTTNTTRLVRRNGDLRPIDESVASIVDEQGELLGSVSAFRDTTERRRAEEALRRGEARKRTILESALDCVVTIDENLRIVEFNSSAERTFGYRRDEVLGRLASEAIIPDRKRAAHELALRRFFRSRSAAMSGRRVSITAMRRDGSEFPASAAIAVSFLPDGSLLCTSYLRDITQERRAGIERERLLESERTARADAERASRLKDEFVGTLSHELRTPLNAMLGWTHLLRRRQQDPKAVGEAIEVIERNARAQVRMVEDLLDMTRILAGKIRLELQQCDPRQVIGAAVASSEPAAHARAIDVQVRFDPSTTSIVGDPTRLQQVVANLLSNAIKFTPERGTVTVECERVGATHIIRVRDTGVGIAADFLPHVFDRFRQADASTTRQFGGLGLGLSIVRHLVELHGGQVQAESEGPGKGSTFTVQLPTVAPLVIADDPDVEEEQDQLSLRGVRVLVVDDEPDARDFALAVLSEEGAEVQVASGANEALTKLAAMMPCVLVSDIGMPGRDGYDLIRSVRALPKDRGGETPAGALTAFARPEDRRKALAAGYQLHHAKPVEPLELVAMVASLERMVRSAT